MKALTVLLMMVLLLPFTCVAADPVVYRISLTGSITPATVTATIKALEEVAKKKPNGIVLEINSGGGDYDSGFLLSKAIERTPIPVTCIVDGDAASMAFFILQSCDKRVATPRSVLMIHEVSWTGAVKTSGIDSVAGFIRTQNEAMLAHCAAKLKISKDALAKAITGKDWFLTPDEALAIGAIDEIVPVKDIGL